MFFFTSLSQLIAMSAVLHPRRMTGARRGLDLVKVQLTGTVPECIEYLVPGPIIAKVAHSPARPARPKPLIGGVNKLAWHYP